MNHQMNMSSNTLRPLLRPAATLAVILAGQFLPPSLRAQVPLPFYEPFPNTYTIGEELGQTGSAALWTVGNGTSSSCARKPPT
jgi:hypothetical protein